MKTWNSPALVVKWDMRNALQHSLEHQTDRKESMAAEVLVRNVHQYWAWLSQIKMFLVIGIQLLFRTRPDPPFYG
jgi:hypothetical protein